MWGQWGLSRLLGTPWWPAGLDEALRVPACQWLGRGVCLGLCVCMYYVCVCVRIHTQGCDASVCLCDVAACVSSNLVPVALFLLSMLVLPGVLVGE